MGEKANSRWQTILRFAWVVIGASVLIVPGFLSHGNLRASVPGEAPSLWIKRYDLPYQAEGAKGILATSDGGFLIYGYGQTGDGNGAITSSIVMKLKESGEVAWITSFHTGGLEDSANGAVEVEDGYIVGGSTDNLNSPVPWFAWLAKLEKETGAVTDQNYLYPSEDVTQITSLMKTSSGDVIAVGRKGSNLWLLKVNSELDTIWERFYQSPSALGSIHYQFTVTDVVETADGGFTTAAFYVSPDHGANYAVLWIIRVNSDGLLDEQDTTWEKSIGDANNVQRAVTLVATPDNGVIVGGSNSEHSVPTLGTQRWLIKLSEEGVPEWQYSYESSDTASTVTNIYAVYDGYIITGGWDGYLAKINEVGEMIWEKRYYGFNFPYVVDITATNDGNFIAVTDGGFIDVLKFDPLDNIPGCEFLRDELNHSLRKTHSTEILRQPVNRGNTTTDVHPNFATIEVSDEFQAETLCAFTPPIVQIAPLSETNSQFFPGGKAVFEVSVKNRDDAPSTPLVHPYIIGDAPGLEWRADGFEENAEILSPGEEHSFRIPFFFDDNAPLGWWETKRIGLWDFTNVQDYGYLQPDGHSQIVRFEVGLPPTPFLELPFDYAGRGGGDNLESKRRLAFLMAATSVFDHDLPNYSEDGFVTSYFGHPLPSNYATALNSYHGHPGWDFGAAHVLSTNVLASAAGNMTTGYDSNSLYSCELSNGQVFQTRSCLATVDHGNGWQTRYLHLQKIGGSDRVPICKVVTEPVPVQTGSNIGTIGNTGCSDASHIHMEVLYNGEVVDPSGWLGSDIDPWALEDDGRASPKLWLFNAPSREGPWRIDGAAGGSFTTYDNTNISIKPGAFPGIWAFEFTNIPPIGLQASFVPTGYAFVINGEQVSGVAQTPSVASDMTGITGGFTIQVEYEDTNIAYVADESTLRFYRLDDNSGLWIGMPTTLDTKSNIASTTTELFGTYALLGKRPELYLPIILKP